MKGEIIMSRQRNYRPNFFFDGKTLKALNTRCPPGNLTPKEEAEWKDLKEYLDGQPFTVMCTEKGWQTFLDKKFYSGKVYDFISQLKKMEWQLPTLMYYFTDKGELQRK